MSRSHKNRKEGNNPSEGKIEPLNTPVLKTEEKQKTPFKTVGTVRLSKSGNAISIKLIQENRFLHISRRDIEFILSDINHATVGNVREYEKLNPGENNGET